MRMRVLNSKGSLHAIIIVEDCDEGSTQLIQSLSWHGLLRHPLDEERPNDFTVF